LIENVPVKTAYNSRDFFIRLLAAWALLVSPALLAAQVSLSTVVDLAQRNSSQVKIAEANLRKAEASLAESKDPLLPSLVVSSGLPAFPSVGFTGGVPSLITANVQAQIFSMPQKQYIGAARFGLKAAQLSLRDAREESALESATAYLELETVGRELEAIQQQQTYAARLVEIAQQRAEAGVDPLADLLQARLTAAQLKLNRIHQEARAATLSKQLAVLTGLPDGAIQIDRASIPEIPQIRGELPPRTLAGIEASQVLADSRQKAARGDSMSLLLPELTFNLQYVRTTQLLNDANAYFKIPLPINNIVSGFSIQIPFFDWYHRDKARESAADALRAKAEAEQAQRQNEVQIAQLTGSLRELDTLSEIASLKQEIAVQQLAAVQAQLESGNGATGPAAPPQLSPKAEQLARIQERQKFVEALDAGLDLSKTRLNLLRALGHMEDWLHELHANAK